MVKATFYVAIRRGMFRAKVVVLLACACLAYTGTHPAYGYFAGLYLADFWGYSLLVLLKGLLALAALVLMFRKPRVAPSTADV